MRVFHEIWNERPHKSEISGEDLNWITEDTTLWYSLFMHVLPKGKYPLYRTYKDNFLLGTIDEHTLIDQGTKAQRDEYYAEKLAEGVLVCWHKFYDKQEELKKKYPRT